MTEPIAEGMARAVAALDAFMNAWKGEDWAVMRRICQQTWISEHPEAETLLKERFGPMRLASWEIEEVIQSKGLAKGVATDATVAVHFLNIRDTTYTIRLICEVGAYKADPRGNWGVNPISWRAVKLGTGRKP